MLNSPLEQFQVIPLLSGHICFLSVSFTNIVYFLLINFIITSLFLSMVLAQSLFVPSRWQSVIEQIFLMVFNMAWSTVGKGGLSYVPMLLHYFLFILVSNLVGMVPYSFTVTSHLAVTFAISFVFFIGITKLSIDIHGVKLLGFFLPAGTPFALVPLLVPIECISFIFRLISLCVRLFANMMAGHTLLKVFGGFSWSMVTSSSDILTIVHLIPLAVIFLLFALELGVAAIQSYVFIILCCIYLNDSINLH